MSRRLLLALALVLVGGCRVTAPTPAPSDPASSQAPGGRLAGPPASLGAPPTDLITTPGAIARPAPAPPRAPAPPSGPAPGSVAP